MGKMREFMYKCLGIERKYLMKNSLKLTRNIITLAFASGVVRMNIIRRLKVAFVLFQAVIYLSAKFRPDPFSCD